MATVNSLTWNKNPEPDVAKYNIYRAVGIAPTKTASLKLASVPATVTAYADIVTADGDYFYALTAEDTAGNESALSAVVDKVVNTLPPSAPTGLSVA